jgi:hypothetical protein
MQGLYTSILHSHWNHFYIMIDVRGMFIFKGDKS